MIGDNKARDLMNALRAAAGEFADYALAKIEDVQPGHSEGLQRRVAGGANGANDLGAAPGSLSPVERYAAALEHIGLAVLHMSSVKSHQCGWSLRQSASALQTGSVGNEPR